ARRIVQPDGVAVETHEHCEMHLSISARPQAHNHRTALRDVYLEVIPLAAQGKCAEARAFQIAAHIRKRYAFPLGLVQLTIDLLGRWRCGFPIAHHHCHTRGTTAILLLVEKRDIERCRGCNCGGSRDRKQRLHFATRTITAAASAITMYVRCRLDSEPPATSCPGSSERLASSDWSFSLSGSGFSAAAFAFTATVAAWGSLRDCSCANDG